MLVPNAVSLPEGIIGNISFSSSPVDISELQLCRSHEPQVFMLPVQQQTYTQAATTPQPDSLRKHSRVALCWLDGWRVARQICTLDVDVGRYGFIFGDGPSGN